MSEIVLKNNKLALGILPDCGGSLSFFKYQGEDVLRSCSKDETEANQTAMFVMIPYASFISDGKFPFFGITRSVATNSPISNYPIHGDMWRQKLSVIQQTPTSVELELSHKKQEGFPYNYTARVIYTLKDEDLIITLKLKNNTPLPMPYGLGVHPFFKKDNETTLQYKAQNIWYRGDDPILGQPYPIPQSLDFSIPQPLPKNTTDISVDNWDSAAQIEYKNFTFSIKADDSFRHLILYAPRGKDFFCLEPVSHTPDAFNLASQGIVGTGIQTLGPNETVSNVITFSLKGKQ